MDHRLSFLVGVAAMILLTLSLLLGCGNEPRDGADPIAEGGPAVGWTTYHDRARGYTVSVPSTWHRARVNLTPGLIDPREILTVATYPPKLARPVPCCARRGPCFAPLDAPTPALDGLGPADVLVSIQERIRPEGHPPPRSRPFDLDPLDVTFPRGSPPCLGDRLGSLAFQSFRDGDRQFYAFVVTGRSAPASTRRELQRVLDSLRFDPGHRPVWS